jgi:hypothetical protein
MIPVDEKHQLHVLDLNFQTGSSHRWLRDKEVSPVDQAIQDSCSPFEKRTVGVHSVIVCLPATPEPPANTLVDVHGPIPIPIDDVPWTGDGRDVNIPGTQISSGDWLAGAGKFLIGLKYVQPVYARIYQRAWEIPCVSVVKGFPGNEADSVDVWPTRSSHDDGVAALVSDVYGEAVRSIVES